MRKPELAAAIAEKADLSKEKAAEVVTAFTDQIAKSLSEGESVTL
ncbi:HU family DNA-binding protein, partial [Marinovum algicola]